MANLQSQQADFMVAGGQKIVKLNETLRNHKMDPQAMLYMNLATEEFIKELQPAFQAFLDADQPDAKLAAIADVADAIADTVVVLMGLCNSIGIPFADVWEAVHRSNMLKFIRKPDGTYTVLKRVDGKIIKPRDWQAPDIMSILKYRLINE